MMHVIPAEALFPQAEYEWAKLRLKFLERMWLALLPVALVAVPVSVARYYFTGWVAAYAFHLSFLVLVLGTYALRKRLSYTVRAVVLIAVMDLTAIGGVLSFALLGSAWWWLLMAGLLAGLLFTVRVGMVHTVLGLLFLLGTAAAYTTGGLAIDFDANEYVTLPLAWATMLTGPALLTICGFGAIGIFFDAARTELREIDRKRVQMAHLVHDLENGHDNGHDNGQGLSGLIPICANCKKIRDEHGMWEDVEAFIIKHTPARFTHALCNPCGMALYGDVWLEAQRSARGKPAVSAAATRDEDESR